MKLQPASRKEVRRIAAGTCAGGVLLLLVFYALALAGIGTFDERVIIGVLGGCAVAILNFALLCLTVQKAVRIGEQKAMKAFIQGSYNGRLFMQAAWIIAAFLIPQIHVIAAAVPMLFPNLMIFFLQAGGKLVTPGARRNPPAQPEEEEEEEEEHRGPFEV